MDFLPLGGLGLGTIDFGEAMRVDVGPVQDYHLLMFCLRGHANTRAGNCSVQASSRRGVICAPGQSFQAELSPDCEQFVLRIDRRSVEAHCGRAVQFEPVLDLEAQTLQAWLDQLRLFSTSKTLMQAAKQSGEIALAMEQLLVQLLLAGHSWRDVHDPLPSPARTGRAPAAGFVRRAEVYMQEHADQALQLADIAQAVEVPVRTLLDAFKRFRDHSPMQYLRDVRLDRAREQLLARKDGTRIAMVAMDCAFTHLGRFAQQYQQRFGESPSTTLMGKISRPVN